MHQSSCVVEENCSTISTCAIAQSAPLAYPFPFLWEPPTSDSKFPRAPKNEILWNSIIDFRTEEAQGQDLVSVILASTHDAFPRDAAGEAKVHLLYRL